MNIQKKGKTGEVIKEKSALHVFTLLQQLLGEREKICHLQKFSQFSIITHRNDAAQLENTDDFQANALRFLSFSQGFVSENSLSNRLGKLFQSGTAAANIEK